MAGLIKMLHVGDGVEHAFPAIEFWVAISKLQGFVYSGRGARWNSSPAKNPLFQEDVRFDRGIASRIQNLSRSNI